MHCHRGQDKADNHNNRAGHNGRQHTQHHIRAAPADKPAQKKIHQTGAHKPAKGLRHAPGLNAVNDGRNKGKGRSKKNGYLAPSADLKQQSAHTSGEKSHVAVKPGQQGNKNQSAKGHKEHLRAYKTIPEAKIIVSGCNLAPRTGCAHGALATWFRRYGRRHRRDQE